MYCMSENILITDLSAGLTSVILPETFNVDYMWLEVRLCRLHIHIVPHMVHTILEAAVLTVRSLHLPRTSNRVLPSLSF